MTHKTIIRVGLLGVLLAVLGLRSAAVYSDRVFFAGDPPSIAQVPLYMRDAVPPLNMLVMGKDHKIYYEAYNDASDLNGDGILDVGYKPALDYYGYYNSYACYNWDTGNGGRFVPVSATNNKQCSGQWSGDFLNYLTTSRMDALRRVLYGGWRNVDTTSETILQGAFFPQDAHSWGKEYQSIARDGYDIRSYSPLPLPANNRYHLFAVTTVTGNNQAFPNYQAPLFRVLRDSPYRVWNWLSIEGPVAGINCFSSSNTRVSCTSGGTTAGHPGHPANRAEFNTLESNFATAQNFYGVSNLSNINCTSGCNPNNSDQDNYLTIIEGKFQVGNGNGNTGWYQFSVDGDDAVDFEIRRGTTLLTGGQAGYYGGHDVCNCNSYSTGGIYLERGDELSIRFRHEEAGGGDQYILRYRSANTLLGLALQNYVVVPGGSGDGQTGLRDLTIKTYDLTPTTGTASRQDMLVRVQSCPANAALRESICKTYPNGTHKPTGILHDFGENQRMYFGLITGSQRNNLEGGVLRRNVSDFATEIDASTGIFKAGENGIVRSIDRLRMIGGAYASGSNHDNIGSDSNWNWANGNGTCPSVGDRAIANGECRMWGNPIAEMMYESLRYFAGAASATPRFTVAGATSQYSDAEDTTLGLPNATWKDPYGNTAAGLNYPACAKPYQTVISDINPSYDGDLPGSAFSDAVISTGTTPANISGFSAQGEGQTIWNSEYPGGGARQVFIGAVGNGGGDAPTAKTASSFGNIRGLSPEEPSKGGTYYSASVARFGRRNDINAAADGQSLSTYSVALASPLPRIEFPVGARTVTLLPFAKTASGTFGGGARKPTNTIVDFYVEEYANFPGQPIDSTINAGRPRAVFRINYEDVEQGNDHDMDAIVRYEIVANAVGGVNVELTSEYAAGSADQNIGYVLSGTTQDGIYLVVRDRDSDAGTFARYNLNTPPGIAPGGCAGVTTGVCNQQLPLTSSRTFTPSTGAAPAIQLKNPLWYAAKYGTPEVDQANWDRDADGDPDNYFLVTNPLELRTQLTKAFDDIANRDLDVGNRAISGARVQSGSFTLQPTFARRRNGKDWIGDISAISIYPDGVLGPVIWSATAKLPPGTSVTPAVRNIRTIVTPGSGTRASRTVSPFLDTATLGSTPDNRLTLLGINTNPGSISSTYGGVYSSADFINYLRGDQSREAGAPGAGNTLRQRSRVLGDIVNSEPVVVSARNDFGYGNYSDPMFAGYSSNGSSGYLWDKRNRKTMVYVGANDGMLHAFDASTVDCQPDPLKARISCATGTSGEELFAFIPNGVLGQLGQLPLPDNNFNHRYYVDGQVVVGDAKDPGGWKSVLVGSTGAGARSIFALDVSNIQNRSSFRDLDVLWERNSKVDNDIGHIYGKPLLVPLENDAWGVLFGNGYGGNNNDPSLYILDAFTGVVIKKITANDGNLAAALTNPITNWVCQIASGWEVVANLCARTVAPFNGLGQITAIDRNGNGKVDTVYGGDQQGNLWKFDLRSGTTGGWGVYNFATGGAVPLFTAETGTGGTAERQPITGGIRVAAGPGTGVMVYFGTGRYFINGDNDLLAAPQMQSLYAVFDNGPVSGNVGSSPAGVRANLVGQTVTSETVTPQFTTRAISSNPVQYFGPGATRGWYLDLRVGAAAANGERFIATPRIQSGRVFFTTYRPEANSCSPGGTNFQYGLDLLAGVGSLANVAVLPSGTAACTNADCGGVAIRGADGNTTQPPITNTSVAAISPIRTTDSTCDPLTGSCATFEECQVVIYPGAFVLPRPCGRQSWRQLK